MEFARFEYPKLIHFPLPAHAPTEVRKPKAKRTSIPPLIAFQLIAAIGLSVLASFLQFEFYREHDVLPGYAWPLAIAGAVGMLSLVTVKFEGFWADLPRKVLYCACYLFMVMSASFHVANDAWIRASKVPSNAETAKAPQTAVQERGLQAMIDALQLATKNRAWNAMEALGQEISKQTSPQATSPHAEKPLGLPKDLMIWIGAAITVALRALLEGIQAVNAVALRKYFGNKLQATSQAEAISP